MRHPAAYYLILIYAISVCKPVLPLVNDWLAHALWQSRHIEAVHHTHGENHVHTELTEAAEQEKKDTNSSRSAEPLSVHVLLQSDDPFTSSHSSLPLHFNYSTALHRMFLERHTPPPKA